MQSDAHSHEFVSCLVVRLLKKTSSFNKFHTFLRALAINCNAEVNDKEGAESKNWRKGKPVRVLRKGHADEKSLAKGSGKGKSKASKHASSYGPEIGVR